MCLGIGKVRVKLKHCRKILPIVLLIINAVATHNRLMAQCTLSADLTGDCFVNPGDLAVFSLQWLATGKPTDCPYSADLIGDDCLVNSADYAVLAEEWLRCGDPQDPNCVPPPNLFFSEYIEGSSLNKALEIYNAAASSINLGDCNLCAFHNGADQPTYTINLLAVELAPGEVFVIGNTSASAELQDRCDQLSGSILFNGDDAIALVCDELTLDVIGQIGFRPTGYWGSADVTTEDHTLRRKCWITTGDPNGSDAFEPAEEWFGFAIDTFDDLGSHVAAPNCPGTCSPGGDVACGSMLTASNVGLVANIDYYDCALLPETGPEIAYSFIPDLTGPVTVTISNLTADLDLFILQDTCDFEACIDYGADAGPTEQVSFIATAGTQYFIVVDGYDGAESDFTMTVECP